MLAPIITSLTDFVYTVLDCATLPSYYSSSLRFNMDGLRQNRSFFRFRLDE